MNRPFPTVLKLRVEPPLKAGLAAVAEAELTTVSELVRRELRHLVASRRAVPQDGARRPAR